MVDAFVLAGGASSRMGSDKARLPLDGWPTATVLCGRLEAAGARATIVRRHDDGLPWIHPDGRPVPVLLEPDDGPRHPLRGVLAALDAAHADVVVVPCDVPDLTVDALARIARAPCVVDGHPLIAHIPWVLRDRVHDGVRTGSSVRSVTGVLPAVPLPPDVLRDRNDGGGPWPVERLRARLAWLGPEAVERAVRAERVRQRARGVVDPSP